jgi:hypothetical protein
MRPQGRSENPDKRGGLEQGPWKEAKNRWQSGHLEERLRYRANTGQSSWPRNAPGRNLEGKTGESPKETGAENIDNGPKKDSDARTRAKPKRLRSGKGPPSWINEEETEVSQSCNSLPTGNERQTKGVQEETTDTIQTATRSPVIGLHQSNNPR